MTTPHPHAEFLHLVINGEDTSDWEAEREDYPTTTLDPASDYAGSILGSPGLWTVRRKPRTIRIGEFEVPEPMRVAPAMGTVVWLVCIHRDSPFQFCWSGNTTEQEWLKLGICRLTKEAAEQQRKALILVSGGTP